MVQFIEIIAGIYILTLILSFGLWFIFMPLGGIGIYLSRKWKRRAKSSFSKCASIFTLVTSAFIFASGVLGLYLALIDFELNWQ